VNLFERWLTLWVLLCIAAGIVLGQALPGPVRALGAMEVARVNLPVAGLMSDRPAAEVNRALGGLNAAARELGSPLNSPFMTLSFVSLPSIPEAGLTDKGLVDVRARKLITVLI